MHLWTILLLFACCTTGLLRLGDAAAEVGPGDAPQYDLFPAGMSQHGGEHPTGRTDSPAPTPVPGVEAPPAATPRQMALADPTLASSAAKRQQLTYLVRCALPAEVELYADIAGERFTFPGRMGLAPRWLTEAMTPGEERWVSACLLALVNYFGKHVRVSIRATPPPVPELETSPEERATFTIFEGGFFGNLFAPEPVAYTCVSAWTPAQARDPILQDRVCTQATDATAAADTPVTACRFLVTGRCEDPTSFTVDGTHYAEVIFVYLRPTQP
jgi:hypothetical protein